VAEIPAPPNDDFADAAHIAALPFTATVDANGATTETAEPFFLLARCRLRRKHHRWKRLAPIGKDTLTGHAEADRFKGGAGRDTATDFTAAEGDTRTSVEIF
jgi:hypothetical protein